LRKKRIVFLCSGGGGNLRFIHNTLKQKLLLDWEVVALICDRKCPAIDFAESVKIPTCLIEITKKKSEPLRSLLSEFQPDLVVTTLHKILAPEIVNGFQGRLINLHYSLLPSFAGKIGVETVKYAMSYGVKICGATVHHVTDEVDAGKPIVQTAFPVCDGDDLDDIMDLEFRAGCISLFTAITLAITKASANNIGNNLVIKNRIAIISPFVDLPPEFGSESFWRLLSLGP
jgi:phosphoribosylglycinamide formyltransferase-1